MSAPRLHADERTMLRAFPGFRIIERKKTGHLLVECDGRKTVIPRKIGSRSNMCKGIKTRLRRVQGAA